MKFSRRGFVLSSSALVVAGCAETNIATTDGDAFDISFDAFNDEFGDVVATDAGGRLLGKGYGWAEGPAWDRERQALYFTDVPGNRAYRWSNQTGVEVFLDPSGIDPALATGMREPGANGLLMSADRRLILCNHGRRAVEKMDVDSGDREVLIDRFEGAQFNSPNDVIEASDGTLYFTDPPYGLEGLNDSPMKELPTNGVYRLSGDGALEQIISDMTFPNGVALTPTEDALLIAQSDPDQPIVRKRYFASGGTGTLWFDASPFMDGHEGLPDGMAVAQSGHVFIAGPGGVLVVTADGHCIGRIGTGRATANCAFGADGQTLFITARDLLLSINTKVQGIGRF